MKRTSCVLLAVLVCAAAFARTWPPKTDNEIVAVDLETGELLWTHKPSKLSDAHFEVHQQGLVVFPRCSGEKRERTNPLYLSLETGKPVTPFKVDSAPLARSATFGPNHEVRLSNGWLLHGHAPGFTKTLDFVDEATNEKVWSIKTDDYPHRVICWKDYVFYAFSYLNPEGVLYAYQAGRDEPNWTIDLNTIVRDREFPLKRMFFQVIDDVLYVEANEHIFAFDPLTGSLKWHRDLASDLGIPFHGGFYGGAVNLATFAKCGDILVISFEKRVVALDLKSMRCLWHLQPDTFPECPFPAAHDGKVFLSSGKNRQLFRVDRDRGAPNEPDTVGNPSPNVMRADGGDEREAGEAPAILNAAEHRSRAVLNAIPFSQPS